MSWFFMYSHGVLGKGNAINLSQRRNWAFSQEDLCNSETFFCGKNGYELNKTNAIPRPVVQGEGFKQESTKMLWFVLVSAP